MLTLAPHQMNSVRRFVPTALLLILITVVAGGFITFQPGSDTTITLPLEVIGPDGYTVTEEFKVDFASGVNTLYLKAHNLSYDGKGSVRINGGSWIALTDRNVTCASPESSLECIGGAYATIRLTVPISGIVKGTNTIEFRHNYRSGDTSSGWRVLSFNLMRNGTTDVLPQSLFVYDDPSTWSPPLPSQSDIDAGEALWHARNSLVDTPGGPSIKAACADCHANDGRDLKYFNYSNHSIVARSEFHGLTQQEGQQIASYIRSLELRHEDGTSYEAPGTPWDPPYQPGPGLDDKPVDAWAAGAGLNSVLDEDIEMLPYLFPDGSGGVDINATHANVEGTLNMRETPLAVQFPDWNNWLPDVHPMDYWGNAFTSGDAWDVYNNDLQTAIANGDPDQIERELNWMTTYAKQESKSQVGGTSDEEFAEARLSMFQWQLIKTWETMHGNHLEDKAQEMNNGYFDEPRSWLGRSRTLFDLAPHISNVNGLGNPPYTYGSGLQDNFFSHVWYHVQVVVNPGADPRSSSQVPVDWNYQDSFIRAFSSATDVGAGLRFVQSWIKKTQMLHRPDLDQPLHGPKGWGPNQTHPYWIMTMYKTSGKEGKTFQNLSMDLRRQLLDALLRAWIDNIQQYDISEFPRGDANDEWEPSDYVPSSSVPSRLYFANMLYRDLPILDDMGVDAEVLYEIALWCEEMWPLGDWESLVEFDGTVNEPPTVSFNEPTDGATITVPTTVTMDAAAQDPDGSIAQVKFFVNGTQVGTDDTAPYTYAWDATDEGSYALKATAIDD
ncbi:MAG: hypothetical protein GVY12_08010, partial [Bacteroidetes bacterium]|nr:hypothetical protein [Bacteroidota bacterium]